MAIHLQRLHHETNSALEVQCSRLEPAPPSWLQPGAREVRQLISENGSTQDH
jgi:hypothetical protein